MAVTDQQKLDFLLKKIGYTKTKTGSVVGTGAISGTPKQPFAEAIPSPLIIANTALWNESGSIPTTPPTSDTNQVKVYLAASSGLRMTADSTSSGQRAYIAYTTYNNTSSARLTNWIDTQFGSAYLIKVYKGDPNSGGVALSAAGSGSNDGWFFDYSAGVLNFNDTSVPSGVTDTNIYIVGYRYIGSTGAPTSGISTFSYLDLTVERNLDIGSQGGISTFRNNIDLNADLDVDGHTNLDNVSIAGVTTFAGTVNTASIVSTGIDLNGDIDVDGHTNLDNVNIAGVTTITNSSGTKTFEASNNGIQLLHNGLERVSTNTTGIDVNGTLNADAADIDDFVRVGSNIHLGNSGIITATSFVGNGDFVELDVDGHTNLDNVSIAGVTTHNEDVVFVGASSNARWDYSTSDLILFDNTRLEFGSNKDFEIWHGGAHTYLKNSGGDLRIRGDKILLKKADDTETYLEANVNSDVKLFFNGNEKFATTIGGVNIIGHVETDTLQVSGLSTFTGNIDANGDLDVDGHTNLDNVSVAGVTTFTGGISGSTVNLTGALTGTSANFSGNLTVGGVLTYEDVKNVDSIGIATARAGLNVSGGNVTIANDIDVDGHTNLDNVNIAGVSTFTGDIHANGDIAVDGHTNLDNVSIAGVTTMIGDLTISSSFPRLKLTDTNNNSDFSVDNGNGTFRVRDVTNGDNRFTIDSTGQVDFSGNVDCNSGLDVTGNANVSGDLDVDGHTNLDNVSIAGVSTFTGAIDANGDLDVDGHTNLDNVSISGVTTFSDHIILSGTNPRITFTDTDSNPDFQIFGSGGNFNIWDATNNTSRLLINADGHIDVGHLDVTNGLSVGGNTTFADDVDVDGHTNLDNVSIAGFTTITQDLDVDGHTNLDNVSIAGVTTASDNVIIPDNKKLVLGSLSGRQLQLYHNTTGSSNHVIESTSSSNHLIFKATTINPRANTFSFRNHAHNKNVFRVLADTSTTLFYNGNAKLTTENTGVNITGIVTATSADINGDLDVDGHTNLDNVSIAGVTTFSGTVNTASIVSTGIDLNGDIDVDGHTNLDNVSIAGVTTFTGAVTLNDDITFTGANYNALWDESDNALEFNDNTKATFGTDVDLSIYHNGSDSYIVEGGTGSLYIRGSGVEIQDVGGSKYFTAVSSVVKLFNNNNEKLATTSTGINITGLTDTDTLTTGNSTFTGTITAGGSSGSNGQYLKSTGTGVAWADYPTARTTQSFTASSGQTTFSFSYNVGYLDVFVNGVKLSSSEFTATNGTSVVLSVGSFVGDIVELVSYNTIASGGGSGLNNIVEDTTPQLGGNLDIFNKSITGTGNINITGIITATSFSGPVASSSAPASATSTGTAGTIAYDSNYVYICIATNTWRRVAVSSW